MRKNRSECSNITIKNDPQPQAELLLPGNLIPASIDATGEGHIPQSQDKKGVPFRKDQRNWGAQ